MRENSRDYEWGETISHKYEAIGIMTMWYCHRNRIENSDIERHWHFRVSFVYDVVVLWISGEKLDFSANWGTLNV